MKIRIEVDAKELKKLIMRYMQDELGAAAPDDISDITIETKSNQNYKSEWEVASFRAVFERFNT